MIFSSDAIVAAAKGQLTGPLYQANSRLLKVVTDMDRSFKA